MTHHSESKARLTDLKERIVSGMRDAVMLTDLDGRILDVNPAFERLYGYSRKQVLGETASLLKSGRHEIIFFHHMWQAIRRGMTWDGNIYNKRKDGSILMVEETITPLFDGRGQVEFFLATMRENIMHGWQSEKGYRPIPKHDVMTETLAHDLSNLITPLLDNAQAAKEKLKLGDDPQDEVDRICRNGNRAKELLRQVLAFCRHDYNGRKDPVSLTHIVKDVLGLIANDLPGNISIETEFQKKNAVVLGESVHLHQVLVNLCSNSMKAMQEHGGCLKVRLENLVINNNSPYLGDLRKGDYIKLSVIDDGVGMDTEGIRRAFDPYYSTRDDSGEGEGHGLGLSIVRRIVEGHLGKVYLKSKLGKGCKVDVLLPSGAPQGFTDTQLITTAIVPVKSGAILFVDDEHSIRQMGKNMLEYAGYSVQGFGGTNEALDCFGSTPYEFDLVITDHFVSGIKGTAFAQGIRTVHPNIPIIFISSVDGGISKDALDALGNCRVLPKPFSSDELLAVVRDLVAD